MAGGTPKTNSFMLSAATVMLAPFGSDPFALTPADHSVGLVKEVTFNTESDSVELRGGGVSNVLIDSRRSNVKLNASAQVYEYTAANVLRALSLGSAVTQVRRGKLTTQAAAAAATLSIATDPVPGDSSTGITALGDIPSGSIILLSRTGADSDYVFPTKSTGAATGTGPYSVPIAGNYAIPAGMSFPVDSKAWIVQDIPVGSTLESDYFSMKIQGTLSSNERQVVLIIPKARLSGFSMNFTETEYGSMPLNIEAYLLSATEATGRLADIGTNRPAALYLAA